MGEALYNKENARRVKPLPITTPVGRGPTSGETSKRARRRRVRRKTVIGNGSEAPGSNTALPKPVAKAPLSKQLDSVDIAKVVDEGTRLDSAAGAPKPVPKPAPKPPTLRQIEDPDGADLRGENVGQRVTPAAATEPIEATKPKRHKTAKMGGNAPTLKVVDGKKAALLRVDRNDTKRPKLAPDLLRKKIEKNPSTRLNAYGKVLSSKEYVIIYIVDN
ncbi:hypothetical protein DM860_015232 [Cuscuta australis]|uniref:Uncharacterized protein n=1 Tax=Cuscuta australis TaxID=267555 RepID=A0A328D389_9ASTE|nr:hypothetical protein DM860_015232 [Cuscuta australis]